MSSCNSVTRLSPSAVLAASLPDPGQLAFGAVRLELEGRYQCMDNGEPFYKFRIIDVARNDSIGEISFMPTQDLNRIGSVGHSGGGLNESSRGRGLYGDALKALAPLARSNGLTEFMVVVPQENLPAVHLAEKLSLRRVDSTDRTLKFMVSASEPAAR